MPNSRLLALTPDALSLLTSLVSGNDVFRLIMCGSRVLNAKLINAATCLDVSLRRFSPFPLSAFHFPRLAHLGACMIPDHNYYHVLSDLSSLLPPTPLKSLRTLELRFAQSLLLLRPEHFSIPLSLCLPNLTSLSLLGSRHPIPTAGFKSLPTGLLRLAIQSNHTAATVSSQMIADLPLSLETLEFDGSALYHPENETWWPDKLKKLVVSNLDCDCVSVLPLSLEWLEVGRLIGSSCLLSSVLPQNVTYLDLNDVDIAMATDFPSLPTKLRFLRFRGLEWRVSEVEPILLGSIYQRVAEMQAQTLRASRSSNYETFPSALTKCCLGADDLSTIAWPVDDLWPRGIVHLSVAQLNLDPIILPPELESLVWLADTSTRFERFPRHLTSLRLMGDHRPSVTFSKRDWQLLPKSLTKLACSMESVDSPECVLQLPNLLHLTITYTLHNARPSSAKIEKRKDYTPACTQLRHAKIVFSGTDLRALTHAWISPISRACHQLESLTVRHRHVASNIVEEMQVDDVADGEAKLNNGDPEIFTFAQLPRSLRKLKLFVTDSFIFDTPKDSEGRDPIQQLPENLTCLRLERVSVPIQGHLIRRSNPAHHGGIYPREALRLNLNSAQIEARQLIFASLPASLTSLSLFDFELTEALLEVIPKGIMRILLYPLVRTSTGRRAHSAYYKGPQWMGYADN